MTQPVQKWHAAAVVIAALLGLLLTSTTAPVAASSIYSVPTIASVDTQALDRAEVSPMQLPDHRERSISRAATAAVTLRLAASFVAEPPTEAKSSSDQQAPSPATTSAV